MIITSAQDLALIIGSVGTAAAAIATTAAAIIGFVIPRLTARAEAERKNNLRVHDSFRNLIDSALVQVENKSFNDKGLAFHLTLQEQGIRDGFEVEKGEFQDTLLMELLRLEILGASHSIDTKSFAVALYQLATVQTKMWQTIAESTKGKVYQKGQYDDLYDAVSKKEIEIRDTVVAKAEELWGTVKREFPL